MGNRALAVIPARGGSKGYPGKNLLRLADRPLLEYSARAARGSKRIERVIVTTDDERIAGVARSCGIEVPFMRPSELAQDDTPMLPVLLHALDFFRDTEGIDYDIIVLLDPTAPFKLPRDIDRCVEALEGGATSACTVCEAEVNPYYNMLVANDGGWVRPPFDEFYTLTRRQDAPVVYRENSVVQSSMVSEANREAELGTGH